MFSSEPGSVMVSLHVDVCNVDGEAVQSFTTHTEHAHDPAHPIEDTINLAVGAVAVDAEAFATSVSLNLSRRGGLEPETKPQELPAWPASCNNPDAHFGHPEWRLTWRGWCPGRQVAL
jgi:hypothetical protein